MTVKRSRAYSSATRSAAADETRARILDAARAVLAGGPGMPAFSLDGVARVAGVTRLTVYNRFESRRGLLEALFDDIARAAGLFDLPQVIGQPDPARALRDFVGVFCRFWTTHHTAMPRFHAVIRLDDELAASFAERTERRRHALAALVRRLFPRRGKADAELVDVLFALTSFEFHAMLCAHGRSANAVEALVQRLVAEAVDGYR
ncbi:TetR/AcrR family transcriptional regulator [Dokdonella fugitiva]|jgi:AcrR family transcriptional regulator|uniref:TetR/AcrR family transcriptional regulator n=1 Tax=Dokdonella fugitiva TaxID=328517 RepID=UPI0015FD1FD3|nr:TetR/AcrR family transcriptional regulator [Dokdonella fugitiva]MBA8884861.1 AcrR family transcriptional regulator [Dokdonella fugitiva]